MIALMPTDADAQRLAIDGGEAPDQLHCTLWFLGGDASLWSPEQRADLVDCLREQFDGAPPVDGRIFGVAHWNGDGDSPSWVWSVGDDPGPSGCTLGMAKAATQQALACDHPEIPSQHTPWVAHICAQYTDDQSMVPVMETKLGPVTFDRVRVSFGDDDTDIPLGGSTGAVTAAGEVKLRRKLTPLEVAGGMDFVGHQTGWKQAVNLALHDWAQVDATWRNQIRDQLLQDSSADQLSSLSVDTSDASDLLYRRMLATAQAAGNAQQREAEHQGVTVPEWSLDDSLTAALKGRELLRNVARSTSDVLGTRQIQSARIKARSLFGVFDRIRLASEVDKSLRDLSEAFTREQLGAAMSAAQAAGRLAVLQAAPSAQVYIATEVLDDNCCQPCREVDQTEFPTLDKVEEAYPGGLFADCLGGDRCRGTFYAMWDLGIMGDNEGTDMTAAAETLGGKPNPGTKRDKRLKENDPKMSGDAPCATCPDDAEHFGSSQTKDTSPWDGAASRFSDPQYRTASAACDPGDGTVKERCFLPHHEPTGALNVNGLHAAASRAGSLKGHSPAAVASAKAHLRAHYHAIGEDVPPSLTAAGGTMCPDGWKPDDDGDGCVPVDWQPGQAAPSCPPGMIPDPDGDGCIMQASAGTTGLAADPVPPGSNTAPWEGVLAVEGITTGDGREFAPDALTWRDLPIPLRWNKEDSHGGEPHTVAVNVGRIDTITRDGDKLRGTGVFNLDEPDGQRAHDLVKGQFLRGVSIDADSIQDADVEMVYPQNPDDPDGEPDMFDLLFGAPPEKVVFHGGRISAATLCDIPAFAEAYVALTDSAGAIVAGGAMERTEWEEAQPAPAAVTAAASPLLPPLAWFQDPGLSLPTPITVTDDGRVYGHAAMWGSCHIGQPGTCVQPPREDYHAHYMTGEVTAADGTPVGVGQITVGTGHASLNVGAAAAAEHYDHTGFAVADVSVGNDVHGIWVAGSVRPDADPAKVAALRAAGQVSGDWRRIGGKLRLVGLLAVNVPGFPVPRTRARVASGAQYALVAAGQPTMAPGLSEEDQDQQAMARVMTMIARRVEKE
jgi:hypothetical protein